jgi:redox-sensitive bicupin YhaK (pirin superfamily)
MSAARGIIHSEMPQQTEGRMRGFQLWINLPAKEKMKDPGYRDIPSEQIPTISLDNGGEARVIAGTLSQESGNTEGAVGGLTTDPLYLDVRLPAGSVFEAPITSGYNAFLYLYEGDATVGDDKQSLKRRTAGLLSDGESLRVEAGETEARFLLLAGKPLGEPIVQYGPFVMNTREEIEQAVNDYQSGKLTLTREQAQRLKVFPAS